jgi:cell division protein FtsN
MKPKPYNRNKRFFFELSRSQLFFSVAGILFILSWVFILGIFVGRGYVSETITRTFTEKIQKLQEEKKALTEKYGTQSQQSDIPKEDILDPKLDFYNKLSQKETAATQEVVPRQTPLPPALGTTPDRQVQPLTSASNNQIKTPPVEAKGSKPAAEPENKKSTKDPLLEAKTSKTTPETATDSGSFLVQIGSYRDEATARASAKRLTEKGYQAQVRSKEIPQKGGRWFRVQIGPFKSRFEAEKTIMHLEHDGFQGVVLGNNF